uniref:Uncharacterized protein n=1 Tax=Cannabis sativa TaxID=3483 RepID=A0A803PUQ9_CANSA
MVDKVTLERSMIKFARDLVDVEISNNPPKSISLENERKQLMEQQAKYEWLPLKCSACALLGHTAANYMLVKVEIIMDDKQFVHYKLKIIGTKAEFFLTAVYGSNSIVERKDLWAKLDSLGNAMEIQDAQDRLSSCDVDQLNCCGTYFTWSNKHEMGVRIFSKLERVFTNETWLDYYLNTAATFKWETISDHCYCLIKFLEANNYADNKIVSYWNDDTIVEDYPLVVNHFLQHLHNFMGKKSSTTRRIDLLSLENGHKLSLEQQVQIIRPFNKFDVKAILFNIQSTKSPRPDGFCLGFFKTQWDDIGEDNTSAVLGFFQNGSLHKEINETTISLIPKKDSPRNSSTDQ